METIEIGLNDLEPVQLSFLDSESTSAPSVNFGTGIELLMNDKKKNSSFSTNVDLGELNRLESELNELSGASGSKPEADTRTLSGFASNLFNFGGSSKTSEPKIDSAPLETDSNLGHATVESLGSTKTWDGFAKMNEIPLTGENAPRMTDREKRKKKRAMIAKLEDWYSKGNIKNNSHFNMDSPYEEVEDEYETVMEEKRKKDSVKLQGWWFMTFVNSIEYANAAFNPFDLNLDGWGEQISEDIESYEEIFTELHDKYKGGKLSPEISLLLRLGFSAAVVNITNKALSTATPGFNDVIRQSPELMKMFTNATVQSMSQQAPGMGFMNNILNPEEQVKTSFGVPPAPVDTKTQPPPMRPGAMQFTTQASGNRPDISMGRGTMFKESGVDISNQYENPNKRPEPSFRPETSQRNDQRNEQRNEPPQRPEMRGPQNMDLNGLLSGLKTREVNIHNSSKKSTIDENDSLVSVASMRDIQNATLPKKSNRRKQKSDRNTISLDI
jgi:hypothetical protein